MKIVKAFLGLLIMPFKIRIFNPNKIFHNKRVAIVGPADSAFEKENGGKIDSYDFVIRLNKALVTWNSENEKYLGTKTDILVHNFHENMESGGGGPLNWELFDKFGVQYLIQPRFDRNGWQWMYNYFKKYLNIHKSIFMLPYSIYTEISKSFGEYHPTRGVYVLYSALTSQCKEVFITGFTFFKTPYAEGYRDNVRDIKENENFLKKQGFHNPDLEYEYFLKLLKSSAVKEITVDKKLYEILKFDSPELIKKVRQI